MKEGTTTEDSPKALVKGDTHTDENGKHTRGPHVINSEGCANFKGQDANGMYRVWYLNRHNVLGWEPNPEDKFTPGHITSFTAWFTLACLTWLFLGNLFVYKAIDQAHGGY